MALIASGLFSSIAMTAFAVGKICRTTFRPLTTQSGCSTISLSSQVMPGSHSAPFATIHRISSGFFGMSLT